MTDYIFLSYGRGDVYKPDVENDVEREAHFTIVEKVRSHLKAVGFSPWLDKYDLTKDRTFQESINDAIVNSRYLLLFIGKHAMQSEWCTREWKHALRHCIPIIPILLEGDWSDGDVLNTYPMRVLSTDGVKKQHIDGTVDEKSLLGAIVNAIQHPVGALAVPMGARRPPAWYIEREQYTELVKKQLGVNDKAYHGSNIISITTQQEVVAIQGIGGIGKTTLAQAICADCDVQRNFDQIFWLDIGPERDLANVSDLMDNLSRRIDNAPESSGNLSAARSRLQAVLQGKRNLLVLDDVWAKGIVDEFSLSGVDCRLLVTTRNKSLVDQTEAIGKLENSEGLRLLATIFDPQNPDPTALDVAHSQIVEKLDGFTLAIEIAGKWLKKYTARNAEQYLARLNSDDSKFFQHLQMSKTDKNANLELSLALSYADLDEDAQFCFRQLGILAPVSTVSESDLSALWELEDVLEPLYALLDLGLIDETSDGTLYSQHNLIRAYASKLLAETDETDAAFGRYVDYIISIADEGFERPQEKWSVLELYLPHIDHIGDELVRLWRGESKRDETLVQRVGDFVIFIMNYVINHPRVTKFSDGIRLKGWEWLEIGSVVFAKEGELEWLALTLANLGLLARISGRSGKALTYYDDAIKILDELDDDHNKPIVISNVGMALLKLGHYDDALTYFNKALMLSIKSNNKKAKPMLLNNIGLAYDKSNDYTNALANYGEALRLARIEGDKYVEGTVLSNLGGTWLKKGDFRKAITYASEALSLRREVKGKLGEGSTLDLLGTLFRLGGLLEEAIKLHSDAILLFQETGSKGDEAVAQFNLGLAYETLGNLDKSIEHISLAVKLDAEVDHPDYESDLVYLEHLKSRRYAGE
ncbi:MAG: hypothetical protein Phog2KO_41630 [Phototrophicaceae bacterium]